MTEQTRTSHGKSLYRLVACTGWAIVLLLAFGAATSSFAQTQDAVGDETTLRNRAFLLWEQNNYTAALPLLEKLAVLRPTDTLVLLRLGSALGGAARQIDDPAERKKAVLRARSLLLRAKELGDTSSLLTIMLEQLPEDGQLSPFSAQKEVDNAVREGEVAFSKSDYPAALAAYQRALQFDPNNYEAALFTGDVYFTMNQMAKAGEWFARAIQINPDRETAYRYWGDALGKEGKMDEARAKFIEAVVTEPYTQTPWVGLKRWADSQKVAITHPKIKTRAAVSYQGKDIKVTLDDTLEKSTVVYWVSYSAVRTGWYAMKFRQQFPNEKAYRHSLREEVDALGTVIESVAEDAKQPKKRKMLDPQLLTLLELHDQGLLEAYVLLSAPDEGIAQDYAAYRAAHRDKLVQYVSTWLISPASMARENK